MPPKVRLRLESLCQLHSLLFFPLVRRYLLVHVAAILRGQGHDVETLH